MKSSESRAPDAPLPFELLGGLPREPRGHLPAVFTVLMTVGYLGLFLILLAPYAVHRGTDSPWVEPPRLGFLGLSLAIGNGFGLLTAIVADRRRHSPWWYLAGHLGALAAPFLALAGLAESHPLVARLAVVAASAAGSFVAFAVLRSEAPSPVASRDPLLRILSRFFHRVGNLWFGLSLLVVVILALIVGTNIEDRFGHKAAQHLVYGSAAFGLFYMVFSASLIAATLRKFPWRFDQVGWLATHAALVLLILGTFLSFWGKKEGYLSLVEGRGSDRFVLTDQTRLQVLSTKTDRATGQIVPGSVAWEAIADFDVNPANTEPNSRHRVQLGREDTPAFEITIDRYFADAESKLLQSDDGGQARLALTGVVQTPMGGDLEFSLVEGDPKRSRMGLTSTFGLELVGRVEPGHLQGLKGGRDAATSKGELIVRDAAGKELTRVVVPVGTRTNPAAPATLDLIAPIPGTDLELVASRSYDWLAIEKGAPVERGADATVNPAVMFRLRAKDGRQSLERAAFAFYHRFASIYKDQETAPFREITVTYDYVPSIPLDPGLVTFASDETGRVSWIFGTADARRLHGVVETGRPLDLSSASSVGVVVDRVYARYAERLEYELRSVRAEERQVIRARIEAPDRDGGTHWLELGDTRGIPVTVGDEIYLVQWSPRTMPLGFHLHLHEFHRDFYPGSQVAKTYESYLKLTDADRFAGGPVNIKIDMNKPLVYDGWRLFQSRFGSGAQRAESTTLQVNRDPGLPVTYPACALLSLGLVIVFFQKPFLRAYGRRLKSKQRGPLAQTLAGVFVVGLGLAATMPGAAMLLFLPEGPIMLLAVLVVIGGLSAESLILTRWVAPRLQA